MSHREKSHGGDRISSLLGVLEPLLGFYFSKINRTIPVDSSFSCNNILLVEIS